MMKRSLTMSFFLGVAASMVGWTCPGGGHPQDLQDATTPEPDACDPCASGETIFGPETFNREKGHGQDRDLVVPADGPLCFLVSTDGTSSAVIKVDDQPIFGPSDFNPHVTQLTRTVEGTAGTHTLSVRIGSNRKSTVTIEVRACGTEPPAPPLCSEVATEICEAKGWSVSETSPYPGNLICTAPGVAEDENCSGCGEYNIVVWEDGSGDRFCPDVTYTTLAGNFYCGHNPCVCGDNLVWCGSWQLQDCIQD